MSDENIILSNAERSTNSMYEFINFINNDNINNNNLEDKEDKDDIIVLSGIEKYFNDYNEDNIEDTDIYKKIKEYLLDKTKNTWNSRDYLGLKINEGKKKFLEINSSRDKIIKFLTDIPKKMFDPDFGDWNYTDDFFPSYSKYLLEQERWKDWAMFCKYTNYSYKNYDFGNYSTRFYNKLEKTEIIKKYRIDNNYKRPKGKEINYFDKSFKSTSEILNRLQYEIQGIKLPEHFDETLIEYLQRTKQ